MKRYLDVKTPDFGTMESVTVTELPPTKYNAIFPVTINLQCVFSSSLKLTVFTE